MIVPYGMASTGSGGPAGVDVAKFAPVTVPYWALKPPPLGWERAAVDPGGYLCPQLLAGVRSLPVESVAPQKCEERADAAFVPGRPTLPIAPSRLYRFNADANVQTGTERVCRSEQCGDVHHCLGGR